MRGRIILITFVLVSAFLVFRPAEQGYSREASPIAIGVKGWVSSQGNLDIPTGRETHGRQQVNLSETVTYPDTDGDGCNDAEEFLPDRMYGGERDPSKKDFFHFGPPNYPPGSVVSFMDVVQVALRVGAKKGSMYYVPDVDVAKVGDYSDASIGPPPTNYVSVDLHKDLSTLGPADGQIGMDDFYAVVAQMNNRCRGPVTFSLADLSDSCGGNFREAGEVVPEPEPGQIFKYCLLVRDDTGKIVNVMEEEVSSADGGIAGSGCVADCGPGGTGWYEKYHTTMREQLWPPDWLRCTPGFGIFPRACAPQTVMAGLYLDCDWRYLGSDNIYNGVVELQYCNAWPASNYPWRNDWIGTVQYHWITTGFQGEANVGGEFSLAPTGDLGDWQQLYFWVELVYGPGALYYGGTN